jgi:hypothetical protein
MLDGSGTARRSTASSCWRLGQRRSGVARAGEDSGEALRRWPCFLAMRGAALEQELASGGAARRPAAALLRDRAGAEEEERGGGRG